MRFMKWVSLGAAILLIITCFFNWIVIPARQIIISGVSAEGTNYGKPGYFSILLSLIYIILTLVPRLWAKRVNFFVAVLNFAWAIKNFILLARCEAGDCPIRQNAFYFYLLLAFVMVIGSLTTGVKNMPVETDQ